MMQKEKSLWVKLLCTSKLYNNNDCNSEMCWSGAELELQLRVQGSAETNSFGSNSVFVLKCWFEYVQIINLELINLETLEYRAR